jgi:putative nucleotidyltransferase with HDIG domain
MNITRDQANTLLNEWVQSEALRRHMYAVEAAMRAYAKKFGEDEELWSITGLLHDFDYEKFPTPDAAAKTGHPFEGVRYLESHGYPKEMLDAILGHTLYSGVPRESIMAKALFACDELCGFVVAVARMRPDKLKDMEASSVKKKLKDKKFAEKVSREDIELGIQELGLEKDEHIHFVIQALQPVAGELGLV